VKLNHLLPNASQLLKNKVTVPRRPEITLKHITGKYAIAVIASGFRICQQVVLVS